MNSKKSQIYAQALFELESKRETFQALKELSDLFQPQRVLDFFLSFTIPKEDKKELLGQVLRQSPVLLKNFFYVLLDNKAFSLLPQIVSVYQNLLEDKEKVCTGFIYSPNPLLEKEKQDIEKVLEKFFNKKIDLEWKEDKSLIGGFYVQAGGFLFDSTVKQQLKQFKMKGA